MSTNYTYQHLVTPGANAAHYGNREPRRKKHRHGFFGLSSLEIIIGTLVGLVEQSIHQDIASWATEVMLAIGFAAGSAVWLAGPFCIALACVISTLVGSSVLNWRSIAVGVLVGLVEQLFHAVLLKWAIGVLLAVGFSTVAAVGMAGTFCIALPCLITAAICKLK
ncbi:MULTISPECIES: hypothetical protein [Enterobacteriaceae]|jgi:hypothetical protein|uniref:Uncharacterized protein n=3 Tax=Leclercia adecarboxylata TaxID=83655 RepID=A0A6H0A365_9ENTR|nr:MULTISPECIES: hypothetical protein [Enterobacteriaceae]UNJ80237.1 hypothetical protein [Leclercia sp.]MCW4706090.1 hypothetical protein [Enterobacter kobei]MDV5241772.1 hypothetical protein [Leclercia adecarboxylata]MDV5280007.1 hypothetical protein [Leclercia adecarboxylata]MDV5463942.1 hypothetical protein [Leclercia adecarboxylata]